jgi:general secretion pathway protein G
MKMMSRVLRARSGFTLAEMMVVIVIIGLLSTLVIQNVVAKYRAACIAKAQSDIVQLSNALNEYAIRNAAHYPEALDVLVTPDEGGDTYLQARALPKDPWKHEYVYEAPTPGGDARAHIVCMGPDGQPGGGDDIDNWEAPGK